jgi:pSer/pThr/pTyr-binding forkhead associated (FHA) protein
MHGRGGGNGSLYCSRCGHPNRDDAKFCAQCGAPLQGETTLSLTPIESDDDAAEEFPLPHDELQPGQALLLVKRGPNAGSTFLIANDATTAGRRPDSDVFLDDVTVSRNHASIERRGGAFFVRDSGSLNGTYVNGERVEETKLASGDEIQIGMFKLVFFSTGE